MRRDGDWGAWLRFFLDGVEETAGSAASTARRILQLFANDRAKIEKIGRAAGSALRVHELMRRKPLLTIPSAANQLGLAVPTVTTSLQHLAHLGIIREITGRPRNRLFTYIEYLDILSEGTEPLPPRRASV